MKGKRAITPEILRSALERGLSDRELALEAGITVIACRAAAKRLGHPFPDGRPQHAAKRLNADRELLAERMRERWKQPGFVAKIKAGQEAAKLRRDQEKARAAHAEAEARLGSAMAAHAARERGMLRRVWA